MSLRSDAYAVFVAEPRKRPRQVGTWDGRGPLPATWQDGGATVWWASADLVERVLTYVTSRPTRRGEAA